MPIKIASIQKGSTAQIAKFRKDDLIVSINQHPIQDFLDLQFFGADAFLEFEIIRGKQRLQISVEQDWDLPLGIIPSDHSCRTCLNHCIFCFIDQMPPNLRSSLYLKDDDVPFSFTFGNFITLTNLSNQDFQKIITQQLTPLYISVHTTADDLHKKMMRYTRNDFSLLSTLQKLSEHGISFHTQIVVVPGYNDGKSLKKTLQTLSQPNLNTLSIGIVPVGLTKFRQNLKKLQPVNRSMAKQIIQLHQNFPNTYVADEMFLLAKEPIPPESYYDDYPQLENGIGMSRMLIGNWSVNRDEWFKSMKEIGKKIVMVTGMLAYPIIKSFSNFINPILPARTVGVSNSFFGESVTVAGLLTAIDIKNQVHIDSDEILCLSSAMFNHDHYSIDQVHLLELAAFFGGKIMLIDEEFASWELICE